MRCARERFDQAEGSQLAKVHQVMGMLAFPPDTYIWPYRDLLDPARWQMLSQQAGLSVIKTPQCSKEDSSSKSPDWPVCSHSPN
ncbi:hypothetical protein GH733_014813 [Mirounga leonina]|nr:hypothetical protein GH733_014813 [Mirounga leonina]